MDTHSPQHGLEGMAMGGHWVEVEVEEVKIGVEVVTDPGDQWGQLLWQLNVLIVIKKVTLLEIVQRIQKN